MYHNRDISWLGFNHRVLQEAADLTVPLMERIKFLSIFSSNMDEFFRVRYPIILLYSQLKNKTLHKIVPPPDKDLAEKVQQTIAGQLSEFGSILNKDILPGLSKEGIELYYNRPIPDEFKGQIREIFFSRILAFMQPVFIRESIKDDFFPESNLVYLLVMVKKPGEELLQQAVVNIPTRKLPRFFTLESDDDKRHIVFLDDIIRDNLGCLFIGFQVQSCFSFKLTRDAELYLDEENYKKDILKELEKKLEKRDQGVPTRFLYEEAMPTSVRKFLASSMGLNYEQLYAGGRYHNLSDLARLPVKDKHLLYPDLRQLRSVQWDDCGDIFRRIEKNDVLLHFPYHSYSPVLTFFNQAAIDPDVKSIYITLYRIAADSHIANALISAAKNKKEVVVFVELKARFDEANNIRWSKEMEKAGVKIIYSIPRIKVHSKIALIQKETPDGNIKSYAYIGTGNFNETTARFYTDHALFTTEASVNKDLQKLFKFLRTRSKPVKKAAREFESILVSQYNMTDVFEQEINAQIKRKKKKMPACIRIKLNNLEDTGMIDLLYKAAKAGVPIKLIVRGICSLNTQEKGLNGNIEVKRIVDRFLEHSRLFIFGEERKTKIYMGSSDWMTRNLHHRIEVCVPVKQQNLTEELEDYFTIQWNDHAKASSVETENVSYKQDDGALNAEEKLCSQQEIYNYLKTRQ